jgi:hypothetical protein
VHGEAAYAFTASFTLAGMEAGAHLKPKTLKPLFNRQCTLDSTGGTGEG